MKIRVVCERSEMKPEALLGVPWSHLPITARISFALQASEPQSALETLVTALQVEGYSEGQIVEACLQQHTTLRESHCEKLYNILGDLLDRMHGWCSPEARLFPNWIPPK